MSSVRLLALLVTAHDRSDKLGRVRLCHCPRLILLSCTLLLPLVIVITTIVTCVSFSTNYRPSSTSSQTFHSQLTKSTKSRPMSIEEGGSSTQTGEDGCNRYFNVVRGMFLPWILQDSDELPR